jgi:hypothetical protein
MSEVTLNKLMLDFMAGVDFEPEEAFIVEAIRAALIRLGKLEKPIPREFVDVVFCKYAKEKMANNLAGFPADLFIQLNYRQFYALLRELGLEVEGEK